MLRSTRIISTLKKVTGDGVNAALLLTSNGELLGSYAVKEVDDANSSNGDESTSSSYALDVKTIGAITTAISQNFENAAQTIVNNSNNDQNATSDAEGLQSLVLYVGKIPIYVKLLNVMQFDVNNVEAVKKTPPISEDGIDLGRSNGVSENVRFDEGSSGGRYYVVLVGSEDVLMGVMVGRGGAVGDYMEEGLRGM